ncbi:hypothetical protein [uncultured Porphyromonas sp.]|uniref:hypothetical protein n=1 Tax=uncultured Porphyromonas sp. TaxID=159274 RepID=UPI00262C31D9|nr:hypothetical protein [uncultured Porphyromonas sp.]
MEHENNPLHPFVTPEGYFDTFKERLMVRIAADERAQKQVQRRSAKIWRPYIYWSAVAAVVLLFVLSLWSFWPQIATEELNAYDITDEEFQQFLLDDTDEDYWGIVYLEDEQNITSLR